MKNVGLNLSDTENLHELLELISAYQKSRVLFTFIELKIPEILNKGKFTATQVAQIKKIHPLAMERFLNACVSIGLLKKEKDDYSNARLTKSFLVKDEKFYLGGQVERHRKRSFSVW